MKAPLLFLMLISLFSACKPEKVVPASPPVPKPENISYAENITPITDAAWMWLFIDTDRDRKTGWEGYDFMFNRTKPTSTSLTVEKNNGGWKWEKCGEATYKVSGKQMEIKIPRAILSLKDHKLNFEFKWADNIQKAGEIMDFYISGDVAPAGRFNFIYQEGNQ